jgi:flagellar basal-body rod protein FlgG
MIRALSAAATGLEAQQAKIANIANDLANVNTDGYKRTTTEFQDLMYETVKEPGGTLGANSQSPVGVQMGMGVRVGASHKNFEPGPIKQTSNPYDIMINGAGFLPVSTPQGETAYTRTGAFHVDSQGIIQLSNGSKLIPQITIPQNAISVQITPAGDVRAILPGNAEALLGQIQVITFQNEQGLRAVGDGLYKVSLASGPPVQGIPGENGIGVIQQGALEASNVDVAKSMVDMITTQRAYEMGAKVMGVADQMLGATVNIK